MSNLIWDDVRFDSVCATEAADELELAARQLDKASGDRAGQAQQARQDWSGATRERFDHTLDSALRQAGDLADALRRAASTIRREITNAATEQQRRVKAREHYKVASARNKHRP